jgi:hypothetical protein
MPKDVMHKFLILFCYLIAALQFYIYQDESWLDNPILLVIGVATVLTIFASPILVWRSFINFKLTGFNFGTLSFLSLSSIYFLAVLFITLKTYFMLSPW